MALPPVLSSIVGWMRAGYPDGVPNVDYIPQSSILVLQVNNQVDPTTACAGYTRTCTGTYIDCVSWA